MNNGKTKKHQSKQTAKQKQKETLKKKQVNTKRESRETETQKNIKTEKQRKQTKEKTQKHSKPGLVRHWLGWFIVDSEVVLGPFGFGLRFPRDCLKVAYALFRVGRGVYSGLHHVHRKEKNGGCKFA